MVRHKEHGVLVSQLKGVRAQILETMEQKRRDDIHKLEKELENLEICSKRLEEDFSFEIDQCAKHCSLSKAKEEKRTLQGKQKSRQYFLQQKALSRMKKQTMKGRALQILRREKIRVYKQVLYRFFHECFSESN